MDGGPSFKGIYIDYLAKFSIRCILPQGRLREWPSIINEVEIAINNQPREPLAGISSFDYVLCVPRAPDPLDARAPPQLERGEFLAAHAARRWLADNASQVASILNAAALTPADPVVFNEGDWVLFECEAAPVTPLDPPYTGPHVVLHVERTPEGVATGFYTIAKVLANEQRGPPRRTRSSKLWPFDASRTTGDYEHQRQLPADMVIVKAVLEHGAPDTERDGLFLVSYLGRDVPTWQPAADLLGNALFIAYCHAHGLNHTTGLPRKGSTRVGEAKGVSFSSTAGADNTGPSAAPATRTAAAAPSAAAPVQATQAVARGGESAVNHQQFTVGQTVFARERADTPPYLATIKEFLPNGKYRVKWEGRAATTAVAAALIQPLPARARRQ